ncbi:MAG: MmgE/PrpD family protein [Candidatus Hydrogenedentes bacterium]|nr:MmgE/PrpD family protein [Candidatus Hydrogenedentota bacterium]
MTTLARKIARWVAQLSYDALPAAAIHEAKRRVLDSIGCALGAYRSDPARIAREVALSAPDPKGASIWGTRLRSRPDYAAFANGAMVRYLDFNDTYLSLEPAHPSDNIPAATALAQAAGLGGKDAILALIIGYEIQCRHCDAASLRAYGWDHVTYGALSTAMAAGKLWGLDEDALEHALGLAGVCNIATRQTRTGHISMWKACAFSNAARNGIFAADLARRGMSGPPEIYEGPKGIFKQLTGPFDLKLASDADFMINRTYIKYWPAEYHAQSAIDAMLQLRPQIQGRPIRSIHIESFEAAVSIIGSEREKWRPTSRETADHSMPYCVAVALLDGDVTLNSFDETRLGDPKILALLEKTTIAEAPELNSGYPEGIPNRLKITVEDGSVLDKRVDYPRGHARNPMTDDEVITKFKQLAAGVVSDATADAIIGHCMNLDTLHDLAPLFEFEVLKST